MTRSPSGDTGGWSLPEDVRGGAVFSSDRNYRYWLQRDWDEQLPVLTYLLLNPSGAGGCADDPTTRRLYRISVANGGGGYVLVNLFASIDTRQARLHLHTAVGESVGANDGWIARALELSPRIVVGWGSGNGAAPGVAERQRAIVGRARAVWPMLAGRELWCVGVNGSGSPRHPGRGVRNDSLLEPYTPPEHYPGR